jgi:Nin one binding (NOB1) Zn-ribbon like
MVVSRTLHPLICIYIDDSVTKKMDLKFCPRCGGDTLLRTSISTNADGEVKIHLKKNMQWTNRGTKVTFSFFLA